MWSWVTGNATTLLIALWWIPVGIIWWLWCGRSDPSPDFADPYRDFDDDGRDLN